MIFTLSRSSEGLVVFGEVEQARYASSIEEPIEGAEAGDQGHGSRGGTDAG
jgi:hypothetical protein